MKYFILFLFINRGKISPFNMYVFFLVLGTKSPFREYLERGLPQPVLTVVEFFSIDKGGFRWGRSYAVAGYFAKILLL